MPRHPGYPFEPKSLTHIRPGDFWGIPTRRGGWCCCGQVLLLGHAESPVVANISDPNLSSWGYKFIEGWAHEHFGRHFPESPEPATDRPAGIAG